MVVVVVVILMLNQMAYGRDYLSIQVNTCSPLQTQCSVQKEGAHYHKLAILEITLIFRVHFLIG